MRLEVICSVYVYIFLFRFWLWNLGFIIREDSVMLWVIFDVGVFNILNLLIIFGFSSDGFKLVIFIDCWIVGNGNFIFSIFINLFKLGGLEVEVFCKI